MSPELLPVLINALSEQGAFQQGGQAVPTSGGLVRPGWLAGWRAVQHPEPTFCWPAACRQAGAWIAYLSTTGFADQRHGIGAKFGTSVLLYCCWYCLLYCCRRHLHADLPHANGGVCQPGAPPTAALACMHASRNDLPRMPASGTCLCVPLAAGVAPAAPAARRPVCRLPSAQAWPCMAARSTPRTLPCLCACLCPACLPPSCLPAFTLSSPAPAPSCLSHSLTRSASSRM